MDEDEAYYIWLAAAPIFAALLNAALQMGTIDVQTQTEKLAELREAAIQQALALRLDALETTWPD